MPVLLGIFPARAEIAAVNLICCQAVGPRLGGCGGNRRRVAYEDVCSSPAWTRGVGVGITLAPRGLLEAGGTKLFMGRRVMGSVGWGSV